MGNGVGEKQEEAAKFERVSAAGAKYGTKLRRGWAASAGLDTLSVIP
jgi:hypothetical protein